MTSANSLIRCIRCGRESVVDFAACLANGWPTCHGYTMTLVHTTADIDLAVRRLVSAAHRTKPLEVVR